MKAFSLLSVAAFLLAACSDGNDGGSTTANQTPIAEGTLSGVVGGQSWTLVSAQTDAFLSEGDTDFFAELYAETVETCAIAAGSTKHHLILSVPKSPGDYPLNLQRNATFVIEGATETTDNLVATNGRLVVSEVTATQVRGGAFVELDANNSVNGSFTIDICAD